MRTMGSVKLKGWAQRRLLTSPCINVLDVVSENCYSKPLEPNAVYINT